MKDKDITREHEKTVSFLNAKLLKLKGFEVRTDLFYAHCSGGEEDYWGLIGGKTSPQDYNLEYPERRTYIVGGEDLAEEFSAPTQEIVLAWILANYGVFIEIQHKYNHFTYRLCTLNRDNFELKPSYTPPFRFGEGFDTPEDAKDAAIDYVLNNLV